ncbi:MAG: Gfo/Idh/MocA family oxidoreductase [Fimbriimonadaceae bacterium]
MKNDLNRRDFLVAAGAATAASLAGLSEADERQNLGKTRPSKARKNVIGFSAPKLDKVRAAFIGVGARGSGHVSQMMLLDGVEIKAICDPHVPSANASAKHVVDAGRPAPTVYTNGDYDYRKMLDRDDIDMVIIATPWEWHVPMAVDAMNRGKHAFVEVPAAITVDGCWELVDTAEKTQRHCMMMENVNYGREELMVLNMVQQGLFGEVLHGEAAYIHDLRGQMDEIAHGTGSWRTLHYVKRNGNLYPTHGLGPVGHYMNINRGDKMEYMSSMGSNSLVRALYAKEHYPEGHMRREHKFTCGDINTTIVQTALGKTIMIQWDEQLPRPYTRHNLLQGTRGCWAGFPDRLVLEGSDPTKSTDSWTQKEGLKEWYAKYDHPLWKKIGDEATNAGGHGGMDFVMLWRIVYCLRNGLPMDQDVYDGASWSVISPLSEWSVANRGQSIDIPDFTRGAWKTRGPVKFA